MSTREWLGAPPAALDRPEALARLARRYLAGHGPADARDLARWAKLTLGDARAAFESIRDELAERADGLVDLADRKPAAPPPQPRLLGPFDPLLLGWVSRAPFVGTQAVVTNNGIFRPFALVDGRVVAIWKLSGNTLTVQPLEKLKAATVKATTRRGGRRAPLPGPQRRYRGGCRVLIGPLTPPMRRVPRFRTRCRRRSRGSFPRGAAPG